MQRYLRQCRRTEDDDSDGQQKVSPHAHPAAIMQTPRHATQMSTNTNTDTTPPVTPTVTNDVTMRVHIHNSIEKGGNIIEDKSNSMYGSYKFYNTTLVFGHVPCSWKYHVNTMVLIKAPCIIVQLHCFCVFLVCEAK